MHRTVLTGSEAETQREGEKLAEELNARGAPAFVQLQGDLGAGKTAFARGFIRKWSELSGDPQPDVITSPTYNIVKVYGARAKLAHLDLYRLKTIEELEQIGFEHYFFELSACLVEWLEQIPEALALRPANAVSVSIEFVKDQPQSRTIKTATSP